MTLGPSTKSDLVVAGTNWVRCVSIFDSILCIGSFVKLHHVIVMQKIYVITQKKHSRYIKDKFCFFGESGAKRKKISNTSWNLYQRANDSEQNQTSLRRVFVFIALTPKSVL